jgi:hypothetical protein
MRRDIGFFYRGVKLETFQLVTCRDVSFQQQVGLDRFPRAFPDFKEYVPTLDGGARCRHCKNFIELSSLEVDSNSKVD